MNINAGGATGINAGASTGINAGAATGTTTGTSSGTGTTGSGNTSGMQNNGSMATPQPNSVTGQPGSTEQTQTGPTGSNFNQNSGGMSGYTTGGGTVSAGNNAAANRSAANPSGTASAGNTVSGSTSGSANVGISANDRSALTNYVRDLPAGVTTSSNTSAQYRVGEALPSSVQGSSLPSNLTNSLSAAPSGYSYIQAGSDVYLISNSDRKIIDRVGR